MDIKEWGAGLGVVVIGGAAYGISQYGLNDALSEDIRHISDVPYEERADYMEEIVSQFADAFASYTVQSETYAYEGASVFSAMPARGTFVEVVTQETPVPAEEVSGIKASIVSMNFCAQEEMTMFTEKGWTYRFSLTDSRKRNIFRTVCKPSEAGSIATS